MQLGDNADDSPRTVTDSMRHPSLALRQNQRKRGEFQSGRNLHQRMPDFREARCPSVGESAGEPQWPCGV